MPQLFKMWLKMDPLYPVWWEQNRTICIILRSTVTHCDLVMPHGEVDLASWWCHQMETFSVLLAICAGNSPVTGEFPAQRPVTQSFDVFFDLRLNKRLSKQSWGCWFEMPSHSLWRYCNDVAITWTSVGLPSNIVSPQTNFTRSTHVLSP